MSVKVLLFANYRDIAGEKEVILESCPSHVRDVIDELITRFPDLHPLMFQGGELKRYVNILVNGITYRDTGGLETPVADGSEIKIFPPVSGG